MPSRFRGAIRISFLFGVIISSYWLANKLGYFPPVTYLFKQEAISLNLVPPKEKLLNYSQTIDRLIPKTYEKSQTRILIEKSQSRLTIYDRDRAIKSYPVVFGANPTGNKLKEGDYKTPEGIFKVRDLYPHPQWSKFIWLDYPNHQSWNNHLQAKKSGIIPLSASIGSAIGIHGVNKGSEYLIDEGDNWTWGCISLKNSDVNEIYSVIEVGTIVKIIP